MTDIKKQSEIVKMRLEYHFGTGIANQWNIPKDMPFMKEFLNEVERLCALSDVVGRSEQLVAFGIWLDKNDKHLENGNITETVKEYLEGN